MAINRTDTKLTPSQHRALENESRVPSGRDEAKVIGWHFGARGPVIRLTPPADHLFVLTRRGKLIYMRDYDRDAASRTGRIAIARS